MCGFRDIQKIRQWVAAGPGADQGGTAVYIWWGAQSNSYIRRWDHSHHAVWQRTTRWALYGPCSSISCCCCCWLLIFLLAFFLLLLLVHIRVLLQLLLICFHFSFFFYFSFLCIYRSCCNCCLSFFFFLSFSTFPSSAYTGLAVTVACRFSFFFLFLLFLPLHIQVLL